MKVNGTESVLWLQAVHLSADRSLSQDFLFNTSDLKVSKKARDFMLRLILHAGPIKQQLHLDALRNLTRYLHTALNLEPEYHLKQQILINRGF